jgi:glycosyltransferase involved in cell wall biosynthesis
VKSNSEADNQKSFLFLLGSFTMGGIQSNFVRLLPYLIERKQSVKVLVITDKVEPSFMPFLEGVDFLYYKDYLPLRGGVNSSAILHSLAFFSRRLKDVLSDVQCIHAVDSETLILGLQLSRQLKVSLSVGCYHPREFTWDAKGFYFRKAQKEIYKVLPSMNRIFFNEEVFNETRAYYQCRNFGGEVIPLGIRGGVSASTSGVGSNRIVSIGRLVGFKSYNQHVINTIDFINEKYGRDFEYHIYGDGPNANYLYNLAQGVRSKVVFHGSVPYSEFNRVLEDAFLFVGCGSALLEAAAAGVPCMYGVDSVKEPLTYGYFHDVPGTNLGEADPKLKMLTYDDFFSNLLTKDMINIYCQVSEREKQKAVGFSLKEISTKWIDSFSQSKLVDISYCRWRYFFSNVIWLALNYFGVRSDRRNRY